MSRKAKRKGGLSDAWNALNTAWHIGEQAYFIGHDSGINDWTPEYWERERNKRKRDSDDDEGKEIPPEETVEGANKGVKRKRESDDVIPAVDRTRDQGEPSLPTRTSNPTETPIVPPFGNAPSLPQTSIIQMAGHGADGEVPIAPIPRAISKIHPDHFNIRLPYTKFLIINNGAALYSNITPMCLIRLNSIYDCLRNATTGNTYPVHYDNSTTTAGFAGVGATDTTAGKLADPVANVVTQAQTADADADEGPQGRNIWQAHFKYYRVLRSDVKLTFLNKNCDQVYQSYSGTEALSTISSTPGDINCFHNAYAVGFELIDEDAQISNNAQMFMMTKNAERTILPAAELARINFSTSSNAFCVPKRPVATVMQYTYNPDTWKYHVEQQGVETRWTAVGANPALDHLLAVRMFHLDSTAQNYDYNMLGVMVQIEYEVQFMECLDSFYKTQYYGAGAD